MGSLTISASSSKVSIADSSVSILIISDSGKACKGCKASKVGIVTFVFPVSDVLKNFNLTSSTLQAVRPNWPEAGKVTLYLIPLWAQEQLHWSQRD